MADGWCVWETYSALSSCRDFSSCIFWIFKINFNSSGYSFFASCCSYTTEKTHTLKQKQYLGTVLWGPKGCVPALRCLAVNAKLQRKVGPHLKYFLTITKLVVPSVLWRCWLGGRKGIRPVKNWVVGCWRGSLSGARCRFAYGSSDDYRF